MKEIDQIQYEKLREEGERLIGRVIPHDSSKDTMYYMVSPDQKEFCATEILDTLFLANAPFRGKFDVIRHWISPEVKTIEYNEP